MNDSYGDVVAHLNETVLRAFGPTHLSGFCWSHYDGRMAFVIFKDGKSAIYKHLLYKGAGNGSWVVRMQII